ncbi:hypothetical protein HPP92_010021 [Vanilla planifolia]|uniref:Calmodulin-binding domain-containing protein n=1 Tax=Vanilla planifolia TaxID=51239 RepID=A0A835R8H7_VANPL|nr:hypothetical protein HPP92_010021 [Vanilla planifolia]
MDHLQNLKIIKPEDLDVETSRQAKGRPDRFGCTKKESSDVTRKSMNSAMGVSSKDAAGFKLKEQKLVKGLNIREKQRREVAMMRSPQLAKTIASIRVKGKKTIDRPGKPKIPPLGDEPVQSVRHQEATLIYVDNQNSSSCPIITKKRSMSPKRMQVSSKPALQLKTKSPVLKPMPQLMVTERITGQRSLEKSMMSMTASMLKVGGKKVSKPNAAASPYKSTNSVAPKRSVKSQVGSGRLDSEKVEEKILHVVQQKLLTPKHIKMRSSQQSSTSFPSGSSISCSKNVLSSFKEAKGGAHLQSGDKTRSPLCSDRNDDKRKQKKITNVPVEDDSLPPRNIPSHERKVGGVQRGSTGQRRLRFRNANGAAETQNSMGEISMKGLTNVRQPNVANLATRSHDPHFVLRHQDVQEKNSQVLFNDVIEETANRLAEVRKSKVKALVGAFETIISLQERAIY